MGSRPGGFTPNVKPGRIRLRTAHRKRLFVKQTHGCFMAAPLCCSFFFFSLFILGSNESIFQRGRRLISSAFLHLLFFPLSSLPVRTPPAVPVEMKRPPWWWPFFLFFLYFHGGARAGPDGGCLDRFGRLSFFLSFILFFFFLNGGLQGSCWRREEPSPTAQLSH